jgi:hypothetical protein
LIRAILLPVIVVSVGYVFAFAVTELTITPLQAQFLPEVTRTASLVFLPHGVRVLTAWLYGWRSIPLLAPSSFATGIYYFGIQRFTVDVVLATFTGIIAAALAFSLFARLGYDHRFNAEEKTNWRDVLLVGAVASIVNSIGTSFLFGSDLHTTSVRLLGDFIGLVACMLLLMYVFRMVRHYSRD